MKIIHLLPVPVRQRDTHGQDILRVEAGMHLDQIVHVRVAIRPPPTKPGLTPSGVSLTATEETPLRATGAGSRSGAFDARRRIQLRGPERGHKPCKDCGQDRQGEATGQHRPTDVTASSRGIADPPMAFSTLTVPMARIAPRTPRRDREHQTFGEAPAEKVGLAVLPARPAWRIPVVVGVPRTNNKPPRCRMRSGTPISPRPATAKEVGGRRDSIQRSTIGLGR